MKRSAADPPAQAVHPLEGLSGSESRNKELFDDESSAHIEQIDIEAQNFSDAPAHGSSQKESVFMRLNNRNQSPGDEHVAQRTLPGAAEPEVSLAPSIILLYVNIPTLLPMKRVTKDSFILPHSCFKALLLGPSTSFLLL